jgi:hypothetical protein
MTANELADKLENILTFLEIEYADYEDDEILKQAVAMLRQQAKEIESLKKTLENLPMSLKDDIEYWSKK